MRASDPELEEQVLIFFSISGTSVHDSDVLFTVQSGIVFL